MRTLITRTLVVVGLATATVSFALALPLRLPGAAAGIPAVARPIPYLPAAFIAGLMLVFLAAVAYELLTDRDTTEPWRP